MYNKVTLLGRLVREPEMRFTGNGTPVTNFTLAVERDFKTQSGEKETDFIDIVVWQKLAEVCNDYLEKGQQALIDGRLQVRTYEVQGGQNQGQKRTVYEVVAEKVKFLSKSRNTQNNKPSGDKQVQEPDSNFNPEEVNF